MPGPRLLSAIAALLLTAASCVAQQDLVVLYKDLHAHPELSHFEERTSGILATELRAAGYTVTDHVGLYPDGSHAFGVVGILKNGPGPTLLIRADMDALPIVEETGVPYASHVMTKTKSGQPTGVMHACGHDVHTTVLIGTARALAPPNRQWHGTVMLIGQPSEETIDGAKAMLADHLYERFGRPDLIIGLHDTYARAAGTVQITAGPAMASSTSVDVTIQGIGGHGAYPQPAATPSSSPPSSSWTSRPSSAAKKTRNPLRRHRRPHRRRHQAQHHPRLRQARAHHPRLLRQIPPGHPRRHHADRARRRHHRRPPAGQAPHRHRPRRRIHPRPAQRPRPHRTRPRVA